MRLGSTVQLTRGAMCFLELLETFVEDFRDVEKSDDVPVFVAYGLERAINGKKRSN